MVTGSWRLLSGGGYGTETGSLETGAIAGRDAQFFMALDVGAFDDISRFKQTMDGIIRQVHASGLRPDFERTYVRGEIQEELAARHTAEGILLNDETLRGVAGVAEQLGVDAAAIQWVVDLL